MLEAKSDIEILEGVLERLFESKLNDVVMQLESNDSSYQVDIPDEQTADLPIEEVLSLVARSSNNYVRVSRFAGIAKAQCKLAKARYDRAYKQNRVGPNEATREKNAMTAAKEAQQELAAWEAVSDLIQGIEQGARVASESSRKILGHMSEAEKGQMRENAGRFSANDFQHYRP